MYTYFLMGVPFSGDYLMHHGIKGQKWGHRRFQNEDGTLTAEGRARYSDGETGERKKKGLSRGAKIAIGAGAAALAVGAGLAARNYMRKHGGMHNSMSRNGTYPNLKAMDSLRGRDKGMFRSTGSYGRGNVPDVLQRHLSKVGGSLSKGSKGYGIKAIDSNRTPSSKAARVVTNAKTLNSLAGGQKGMFKSTGSYGKGAVPEVLKRHLSGNTILGNAQHAFRSTLRTPSRGHSMKRKILYQFENRK